MSDQIHQVRRVLAVVNGKGGIEADLFGIFTKQSGTNTMEGAGPAERVGHDPGISAKDLTSDPLDAPRHLGRSAPRERHQQDPTRVSAADDEVGNTVGDGIRLAGPGTGDDQQRSPDMAVGGDPVLDGSTLFRIERLKI